MQQNAPRKGKLCQSLSAQQRAVSVLKILQMQRM